MRSPRYRTILPMALAQQLEALAEESDQTISATIRRCIELALHAPELRVLLHAEDQPVLTDTTTEAQRRAWADYQANNRNLDHGMLLT